MDGSQVRSSDGRPAAGDGTREAFESAALPHLRSLYRLALRLTGNRSTAYERIAEEDPFPYSDDLHGDFLAQFKDEDVRRALLALPEPYRLPLVLVYVEDMSYRELAEVLECPIGTVMSRLHRGRKALEHALWECAKRRGFIKETSR